MDIENFNASAEEATALDEQTLEELSLLIEESYHEVEAYFPILPVKEATDYRESISLEFILPLRIEYPIEDRPPESVSEAILKLVAKELELHPADVIGPKRSGNIKRARHAIAYILRENYQMSYLEIAEAMNRNDHTAAIYNIQQAKKLMETDSYFKNKLGLVLDQLQGYPDHFPLIKNSPGFRNEHYEIVLRKGRVYAAPIFAIAPSQKAMLGIDQATEGLDFRNALEVQDGLWKEYIPIALQRLEALHRKKANEELTDSRGRLLPDY